MPSATSISGAFGLSPALSPDVTVEFLAKVIDQIAHPIFVKDSRFRFVLLNHALCEMVGYRREDLLGKTDYDFFPKSEADFFRAKDEEMFATGSTVTISEEPITDAEGNRHVLATSKVPLRSASGEVTHLVGIIHDITRLKVVEEELRVANEGLERRVGERTAALRAAQAELVRKERLAVVGELAGSVAHHIRNPLGAINNAAYVLQRAVGGRAEPEVGEAIRIILEEVAQANRIVTEMVGYARVRPAVRRPAHLQPVVERALEAVPVAPEVTVDRLFGEAPLVDIDEDQVRDALCNLIRNALEAMPEGGVLTVSLATDGGAALIGVADTGLGVPSAVGDRLFEPLVTTKELGLGLGLSTTRALIENQGGSTTCESTPGCGTRIVVRLPAWVSPDDADDERSPAPGAAL